MRKLYPFGWIDRDIKNLGFLKEMSASAAKLYILYVLAGGADGRSNYGIKALMEATGLSNATIYKARQELEDMGLITTQKEMVCSHKNKKPKIWVELQDLPVDRLEFKRCRTPIVIARTPKFRGTKQSQSIPRIEPPGWIKQAAERLRKNRETYV